MSEETSPDVLTDSAVVSVGDIELAYREALAAIDAAEVQVDSALVDAADTSAEQEPERPERACVSIGEGLAEELQSTDGPATDRDSLGDQGIRVSPREVIEAALFVGGDVALTARRLAGLIGTDTESQVAVRIIDQLNDQYAWEKRPYEIRLHEGGFRLQLREEFSRLQTEVFGLGPREVRLSPAVLEVLAFVAWNQPLDTEQLETTGHERVMTVIRQLIRLELVEVERTGNRRTDVAYRTGQRFLELFQLASIDDLPQADIFEFK